MSRAVLLIVALSLTGCPSLERYYRALHYTERLNNVAFVDNALPAQTLDFYAPKDLKAPFPVVVFVHGGYWRSQDKAYFQPYSGLYGNVGTSLAELGIGVVNINYRLFPNATFSDMLDDVVHAIEWAHVHVAEKNGDPSAIFLAGHSAGGHLVAFLATHPEEMRARGVDPDLIRGVVSLSGVYDIPANVKRVAPELRDGVFLPLFGEDSAHQLAASPMTGFGPAMTPTYFIVGELDYPGCAHDHAEAETLLAPLVGDRAFFARIPGNTHEDMVLEIGTKDDEVTPKMAAFVRFLSQ